MEHRFSRNASMKLFQLEVLREIVRQNYNLTRTADHMHVSQPALTRQLQLLEASLGVPLLIRKGGRFVSLSEEGNTLFPLFCNILNSAEQARRAAKKLADGSDGMVTVGTANTHAQYALPSAIRQFVESYPNVMLRIRHGNHKQALSWAQTNEVDFVISTRPDEPFPDLIFYPCYEMHRTILTRPGHPLLSLPGVTLEAIASYPLITYDRDFPVHTQVKKVFEEHGIEINIALSGTDTDIVKTYVRTGLGIGIVAHTAYDPILDPGLCAIDVRHLFKSNMAYIAFSRNSSLNKNAIRLIQLILPNFVELNEHPMAESAIKPSR